MTEKKKRIQNPCNFAMRLEANDKAELCTLAAALNRSQVDTIRVLVHEARHVLPALKACATSYPLPKKTGRPKRH